MELLEQSSFNILIGIPAFSAHLPVIAPPLWSLERFCIDWQPMFPPKRFDIFPHFLGDAHMV